MKKIAVSLLALTLAVFLAVPAMAEFEPYGEVKLITGWWDIAGHDARPNKGLPDLGYDAVNDDEDLRWDLCNFSAFGARFKTGDIGGHIEFDLFGSTDNDGGHENKVDIALLYGTWDFAGGTLKVGQDYAPYTFPSAQIAPGISDIDGDNRFIGFGALWDWYEPQVELKLDNGLYLALIQPQTGDEDDISEMFNAVTGAAATGDEVDVDTDIPKICVGYEFKTEGLMLNPGVAYSMYNVKISNQNRDIDDRVNCWLAYLNGKVDLGLATIQGSLHYGQNLGDEQGFGLANREFFANAQFDASGDIEDSDCYGGYIQVAFPIDPATITLGYGFTLSETDSDVIEDALGRDDSDEQQSFFINCKIPIADTFFIVPEVSYYDKMEIGDRDEAEAWFAGIMWQMDF